MRSPLPYYIYADRSLWYARVARMCRGPTALLAEFVHDIAVKVRDDPGLVWG